MLKALAKSPADRYQTASEMRDDINRLLNGHAVKAVAPTVPLAVPVGAGEATRVLPTADLDASPTSAGTASDTQTIPQRAVEEPRRKGTRKRA